MMFIPVICAIVILGYLAELFDRYVLNKIDPLHFKNAARVHYWFSFAAACAITYWIFIYNTAIVVDIINKLLVNV